MAAIDTGAPSRTRAVSSDVNMIPLIDLLMVTIAFLLITAVWSTNSQMAADTSVPGPPGPVDVQDTKTLDVHVNEQDFALAWRSGGTVISELRIPRPSRRSGEPARYPELAKRVAAEWAMQGNHRDPADPELDIVRLHTDDRVSFQEIVAVMDALYAPKREMKFKDGSMHKVPVFNLAFSAR